MMLRSWLSATIVVALTLPSAPALTQESAPDWHPMLAPVWGDSDSWQKIGPDELTVDTDRLDGLRVRYLREEGLTRDPVRENVSFQFQRGWTHGRPVLLASFFASGDPNGPRTAATRWNMTIDAETLVPIERTTSAGWGLAAVRATDAGPMSWRLGVDDTDWSEPQLLESSEALLDLSMWGQILSALPLRGGMEFRTQSAPSFIGPAFRVIGRTTREDLQGRAHEVWEIETPLGTQGWIGTTFLSIDEPFFVGFDVRHVESGDLMLRWRLAGVEHLES